MERTDQKCADPDEVKARQSQSRRSALQKLCADLGANYLTRARNEHAKAGNLNNGLTHSVAPIVVVFDADHVPFRSFLRETIGYFFTDPKLFLVQTPHVFLNRDPIERNLRTFDHMPSENEMFYSVTQRGLDKWNGSFFCGSAALLRRAALETTNGFSGITVTEDCETAFELHRAGWTSVYVDKPLTAGLQPETFKSFIGQRSRWCQGMFQLLLLKNPALKPGLTPIQRLAYLSSMTFWFFPLPRLVFMFAPLLHIFFDVKLFISTVEESIAYAATYVVVNTMIQNELFGHVRWPWMSELYEYVQGVYLVKAIGSVVASPRKPTFNVTAKGVSLETDHLSGLAWPFIAIFLVLLLGVATAAWRYAFEPGVTNVMLVVGLWALFNLLIAAAALGVVAERRELRRHPRLAVSRRSSVCFDGHTADATIVNVSAGGCAIRVAAADFIESPMQVDKSHGPIGDPGCRRPRRHADARRHSHPCGTGWRSRNHRPEIQSRAGRLSGARRPHLRGCRRADEISDETSQAHGHPAGDNAVPALERMRAVQSVLLFVRGLQAVDGRPRRGCGAGREIGDADGSPGRSHQRASRSCRGGFRSAAGGSAVDFSGSVGDRS